mgnify:FL=1
MKQTVEQFWSNRYRFKEELLDKYLSGEELNSFEKKKLIEYVDKTSLAVYYTSDCRDDLPPLYVEYCKLKEYFYSN